jgi:glutathione synthase/RimK-type ligase-like ATP-grasp enzyme
MHRIVLAVSHDEISRKPELPLATALSRRSCRVALADWQDPATRWDAFDLIVVRTVYTYARAPDKFLRWLDAVSAVAEVINDAELIKWNMHKSYLLALAAAGVPVVPTRIVARGDTGRVSQLLDAERWPDAVVKPAIGVGGIDAHRISLAAPIAADVRAARLRDAGDIVVQPYVRTIEQCGEDLLIFIDGTYSHAVRRLPPRGGWLTHVHHGGTVHPLTPTADQISVASCAYAALPGAPVMARFDLLNLQGNPVISEVEVLDPHLYTERLPSAAPWLADVLISVADTATPPQRQGERDDDGGSRSRVTLKPATVTTR